MKTKAFFILVLAFVFAAIGQVGALTLDTAGSAPENAAEETAAALNATETAQIPGRNYITGTTAVDGFEYGKAINDPTNNAAYPQKGKLARGMATASIKSSAINSLTAFMTNTVSAYPSGVTGNDSVYVWSDINTFSGTGNNQLKVKGNFENGRRYWFAFDYYTNMFEVWGSDINFNYYVTQSGASASTWTGSVKPYVSSKQWFSYNNKEYTYSGTDGGAVTLRTQTYNADTAAFYYDNIMVMPYYKINYHMPDGSVVTDQVLFADSEKTQIITAYTPRDDNYPSSDDPLFTCIGWSTEEQTQSPMTSVSLANADIDLYPVFDLFDGYIYVGTPVISAVSGTTATVLKARYDDPTVTYTFDAGKTGAAVTDNGSGEFTVTAAGMPGVITFTATPQGGEPETATVRLFGGTEWKPGLDLATGTTETFGFDGYSDEQIALAYKIPGTKYTVVTEENNTFVTSTGAWKELFTNTAFSSPIETGRPITLWFKKKGSVTSLHLLYNNSGTSRHNAGDQSSDSWSTINNSYWQVAARDSITNIGLTSSTTSSYSFDDIRIVPSYKITYDGVGSEWFLLDAQGDIASVYTPNTDNYPANITDTANGTISICVGWSTDPLAASPLTSVALDNADITLYPVWETVDAEPTCFDLVELRTVTPYGMRFNAFISGSQRQIADEYGFIVARAALLENDCSDLVFPDGFVSATDEDTTFNGVTDSGVKFAGRAAYAKCFGLDRYQIADYNGENGFRISGVLIGLSGKAQFEAVMAARPYIRIGDTVFYGNAETADLYTLAKASAYQDDAFIRQIIETCEGN